MVHNMSSSPSDDQEIFLIARSIADPDVRERYLMSVCAGDPGRLEYLRKMLQAHDQSDSLLDPSSDLSATLDQSAKATVGDQVGPYKLLQEIGEGGFGTVFMAQQVEPVRRKVALKMIKPGMDSREIVARFEAERQALALMDHPNIAKVLDAGTTPAGYPYFVMELVKGISITLYADENRLSTEERLHLFIDVCRAVQHAHHKGVIHRDIKPSNVMVTLHDGKPVPKVIDFGVAKALSQPLTDKTLFTRYGQTIGTVLYMSPEQAEMSGLEIDTRGDVYSLGVVLYELLTGRTPFTADELRSAGLEEMRRLIRETDPAKPSKALRTLDNETATTVASHRSCKPESLAKQVRGELDGIVMKCLEKDRNRRYDSPNALADDITNHLNNEPVNIPTSYSYQLLKAYRRNRAVCLTGAAVFASLLIGLIVALMGWSEARRQTEVARDALVEAGEQTQIAEDARVRLKNALTEWHFELIDRGLEAAFRGDINRVNEVAEKARDASAPEDWCLILEALAFHFGGDSIAAGPKIEKSMKIDSENRAVYATLLMSRLNTPEFDQSQYEEAVGTMRSLPPSEKYAAFEELLVGWAHVYIAPIEARDRILSAREQRGQKWPIADALLAHALGHVAIDTGSAETALKAVQIGESALAALPESPFVRSISFWTHVVAVEFCSGQTGPTLTNLLARCDELFAELDQHQTTFSTREVRSMYAELRDRADTAELFDRLQGDDWFGACREAYFYRTGETNRQHDLDPAARATEAIAKFAIDAFEGKRTLAEEGYNDVVEKHDGSFVHACAVQIPFLLGDNDSGIQDAKKFLKKDREIPDYPFYLAKTRLEYFAGEISSEELIERVHHSKQGLCYAHYAIAVKHLGNGEQQEAIDAFNRCVETGVFFAQEYYLAKAFLVHLNSTNE